VVQNNGNICKLLQQMLKRILNFILATVFTVTLTLFWLAWYFLYTPSVDRPLLSGEYREHVLDIDGYERHFASYEPSGLPENAPLIFVFHGSRGSGERIREATRWEFDELADRYGFIVVYPDGFENHWNDCRASADYTANTREIDDIDFIITMIDYFEDTRGIDPRRAFAAGLSNGGHMVYRLAFETPERFAGFAAVAANLPVTQNLDCVPVKDPVSLAVFNGTRDPINPYWGGLVSLLGNDSRGQVISTEETANYWRELAGISPQAEEIPHLDMDGDDATSVRELRWTGNGKQVRMYTLAGSGHVWPTPRGRFPRIFGGDAGDISAAEEIVEFFLQDNSAQGYAAQTAQPSEEEPLQSHEVFKTSAAP
jgi:polyhydroxybutyrate depolymerase